MSHYLHHVPGRLRIKTSHLKRNEAKAEKVRTLLEAVEGILACQVNTITGSAVVTYEPELTTPERILHLLKEYEYVAAHVSVGKANASVARTVDNITENVGKAIFGVVVEKALERSALALIGAIL
jgi:NADPH-dependent curcumin reductase CurA